LPVECPQVSAIPAPDLFAVEINERLLVVPRIKGNEVHGDGEPTMRNGRQVERPLKVHTYASNVEATENASEGTTLSHHGCGVAIVCEPVRCVIITWLEVIDRKRFGSSVTRIVHANTATLPVSLHQALFHRELFTGEIFPALVGAALTVIF
jgi:hypothetical protein